MRHRSRRAGWLAAAALALVGALLPSPAQAADAAISFYVVDVDGTPVSRPYVATFDATVADAPVHWSRGGLDGRVDVVVPAADPSVAARMAAGRPLNLLLIVTDNAPGSGQVDVLVVAAGINLDGPTHGLPVDSGHINGKVFGLVRDPGASDFVNAGLPGVGGGGGDGGEGSSPNPPPNDPDCPGPSHIDPWDVQPDSYTPCNVEQYPPDARHSEIPLYFNYGAGRDMWAEGEYHSTVVTTSTIAGQLGVSGFFEINGAHHYEDDIENAFLFPKIGPQNLLLIAPQQRERTVTLLLDTAMVRKKRGYCTYDWDGDRHCNVFTWYTPGYPHGAAATVGADVHDLYDPARQDCWTEIIGAYQDAIGETHGMSYSLTLGPSETWSTSLGANTRGLHANTVITGTSKEDSKRNVRRWGAVDNPAYVNHYLFVPYGENPLHYQLNEKGGGTCPEVAAENAWTYATDDQLTHLPAPVPTPSPPPPAPTPTPTPSYTICPLSPDDWVKGGVTGGVSGVVKAGAPDDDCG